VLTHQIFQRIFEDINKQPPADLMDRLANLEAHRHQVNVVLFTKLEPSLPKKLVSTLQKNMSPLYNPILDDEFLGSLDLSK
jgi:hypothetical protein